MKFRSVFLAAMAGILGHPFAAAAQAPDGQFLTFTRSAFYQSLINRALSGVSPIVFRRCPSLVSTGSKVIILKPVTLGADGYPNAGRWRQTFPISGCGNDTTLNIYFTATPDEKVNTIIAVPGTTHADPVLQHDARMYAAAAVTAAGKACQVLDVKNTKFESYGLANPPTPDPGSGSARRPWWETWTMIGCGAEFDVPLDFVPVDQGTQVIQQGGVVIR